MQPEHGVPLALFLEEVEVLPAAVVRVLPRLPLVGGDLPAALAAAAGLAVEGVRDTLDPAVAAALPPAGEVVGPAALGPQPGVGAPQMVEN